MSPDVRAEVARVAAAVCRAIGKNPPPDENLHVTLKFLGDVGDEMIEPVRDAVARAARASRRFGTQLGALGGFPSARRARVVWIGCSNVDAFARLATSVDRELAAVGVSSDARPFRPHITLARVSGAPVSVASLEAAAAEPLTWVVDHIVLVRSHLRGSRPPEHEVLAASRLMDAG